MAELVVRRLSVKRVSTTTAPGPPGDLAAFYASDGGCRRLVDDRRRPILWYACDSDDHAALEILLDQGCALSAFVPIDDGPGLRDFLGSGASASGCGAGPDSPTTLAPDPASGAGSSGIAPPSPARRGLTADAGDSHLEPGETPTRRR